MLAACTDSSLAPANTQFEITATVQNAQLLLDVVVIDLTAPVMSNLLDDATITATFRGQTLALRLTDYGPYQYGAAIDVPDGLMADEPISVTVSHGDTTETVTNAMPADFTLVQPPDVKVGDPVELAWSPTASDPMTWNGECGEGFDGPVPTDTGMLELPAVVFAASPMYGCTAELTMTRVRTAAPYSDFVIFFQAEQQHEIHFEITP